MDTEPPSWQLLQNFTSFLPLWGIVVLLALLFIAAVVSGCETVLSKPEVNHHPEKRTSILKKIRHNPDKLNLAILLTKTATYLLIIILSNFLIAFWGEDLKPLVLYSLKVAIPLVLIVLLGEIIPKIYADKNPERFLHSHIYILYAIYWITLPATSPLYAASSRLYKKFEHPQEQLNLEQLSQVFDLDTSEVSEEEGNILKGVISFGHTEVKRIMKPRVEIFALSHNEPYEEVLDKIIAQGYSRIPVYEENLDNIIGVLYVKDLVPHIHRKNFNWVNLLRSPYFITETKKLNVLLNDFKTKQVHLAIVTNEYGGTEGIVSLEDVIEEIVGEISDEYDQDEITYTQLKEGTYVFEGKTVLKDFYRILRIDNADDFENARGDAETLAGFVLEISSEFPKIGSIISFRDYSFTVEAFENKRISQIKVTKINHAD